MTVYIVIIVAVVILLLVFFLKTRKKTSFFKRNTVVADAIVLNIQLTGLCIKSEIQAVLLLQVHPERGKSFVTDIKEMLNTADYTSIHPGTKLLVSFNPRNNKELSIIKESIAASFTINEPMYKSM